MQRKQPLANDCVYHIFNRSIAGYTIFPSQQHYERFGQMLLYYQHRKKIEKFSFAYRSVDAFSQIIKNLSHASSWRVDILAYCLMPNHFHLILKQNSVDGISNFMRNVQNSYSHFFNLRHKRQGPLWAGKFKNVLCETNEQLLHLSRYVHLNPVTAHLVNKPEDWPFTSFHQYTSMTEKPYSLCRFKRHIDISPENYYDFVKNHIEEQRSLAKIKHLLLD